MVLPMKSGVVLTFAIIAVFSAAFANAQKLQVEIIDRQSSVSDYVYVVPGFSSTQGSVNSRCTANVTGDAYAAQASQNCLATASATGTTSPGFIGSYQVRGATLSLQLPDKRIAVVNCNKKVNWTWEWTTELYRDCRTPLINKIDVEFSGDNAKLKWPVSIDGKKMQSETYKILGIIDGQSSAP